MSVQQIDFYYLIMCLYQLIINQISKFKGMYYRRWTRMHIIPALKYYTKLGVISEAYNIYKPIFNNIENPLRYEHRPLKRLSNPNQKQLDQKLINKLFLKYPDLKYQAMGKSQYKGDQLTTFSYSYSFLQQQKKLIKEGYTIDSSFQIVQKKFHEKIKRKLDQSLISRNLAIGNRARSFLTIYQQQIQYESRLKAMRTKREVDKYQAKLNEVKRAVQQDKDDQYYTRMFLKITDNVKQAKEETLQNLNREERREKISQIEKDFKNMFSQFYQRAAYKDRLEGLSDEQIKQQILASPSKIKNQTRELISYLRNKLGVYLNQQGDLAFSDPKIDPKIKKYLLSSPKIKIALLNEQLGYEKPNYSKQNKNNLTYKRRIMTQENLFLSKEQAEILKQKKLKQYEAALNQEIPPNRRSYRIFQTQEQRLIRLELKFLNNQIARQHEGQNKQEFVVNIKDVLDKFRRLKFRLEKRYRKSAREQLLWKEHEQLDELINIEDEIEFENLIQYLRKRTEQRRLTSIDKAMDNAINEMINPVLAREVPGDTQENHVQEPQTKTPAESEVSQNKEAENQIQNQQISLKLKDL